MYFGGYYNFFSHGRNESEFQRILNVSLANSLTLNCSALLVKISSCNVPVSNRLFTPFRSIFLRWLNAVFTRVKKAFSLFIAGFSGNGFKRMTALLTLG